MKIMYTTQLCDIEQGRDGMTNCIYYLVNSEVLASSKQH